MIKIVKEAYTENFKVVCDPEYVTIQYAKGGEPLHFSKAELSEIIAWLSPELNRVLPEIIPMVKATDGVYAIEPKTPPKKPTPEPLYEPGPRSATQTVEIKVGDPDLAYRATGGRTGTPGDGLAETIDLGALAAKVGHP